jgi:hypothetical protein
VKRLRKKLKGWNINIEGRYKKLKKDLTVKIKELDVKSEVNSLTDHEKQEKIVYEARLRNIVIEEETKVRQKSREKFIMEGDNNTKYFHLKANGKRRKMRILSLLQDDHLIQGEDNINALATNFYRKLFGTSDDTHISMSNVDMARLGEDDKSFLTSPFSIHEIHNVVKSMKHNSAPGPDGLPAEFYQDFWEVISFDLCHMFEDFHKGVLPIERLNYGIITLLPKTEEAKELKNCRPICLLNVSYKIITKPLNNRLVSCITKVISNSQLGFLKERYILDSVVALHEILHEVKKEKQNGIMFKVDFEKAYDKVNWQFLHQMIDKKGFGEKWCDWVMKTVRGGEST